MVKPGAVAILAIVVGLFPILDINDWRPSAPVFFLATAWLAIVLTGLWLWRAGLSAATEDPAGGDVGFEMSTRRDELMQEKRVLLKAIKEIEFDRQMGKMSDADAEGLTRLYRKQAVEVMKALDLSGEGDDSPEDRVERELRARLAVAKLTTKKAKRAKAEEPKPEEPKSESEESS